MIHSNQSATCQGQVLVCTLEQHPVGQVVQLCPSCSVVSNSLRPHVLYSSWNYPGQNTEVGSLSYPQGIFPTQELNWGLLHSRRNFCQMRYQGSPHCLLQCVSNLRKEVECCIKSNHQCLKNK